MVNSSNDAQFASLYGRLLSGTQGVTPTPAATGIVPIASLPGPLAGGFCQPGANTEPCSDVNSAIDFCVKHPGTGPCLSTNSAIEFCSANPDKDPCPSIQSAFEFCQKNPTTGPCPSINPAVDSSDFCKKHPGTSPCPSIQSAFEFCQKNPTTGPCPSINPAVDSSDFCKKHPGTSPCPGTQTVTPPAGPQSSLPFSVPTAAAFPASSVPTVAAFPASSISETSPSSTSLQVMTSLTAQGTTSLTAQVTTSLTAQVTTSLTAQVTTSNHRVDLTPILAGILIPAVLLVLAGTIMVLCRRRHARYAKDLESTRVHLPEPEWVQFHNPEPPAGAPGARVPGAAQNHHPEKRSRDDEQYLPAQASSSTILAGPGLSRAPTYRTLPSPPPHYFSDFQQQLLQLLRGNNVPAVRRSSV
ncbi:hypothetical protein B0H13DRAFT_2519368 [Mycena leptocephala]|nr:hypothetical protein B0H13DRAFT_2519368 [Mycena leptocephala]